MNDIETLRKALEPFAKEADCYEPFENDDLQEAWDSTPRIGQLRRCREALAALDRLEANKAVEGYAQFRAMRRRAEKAESERDALRAKLEKAKEMLRKIDGFEVNALDSMVNQVFRLKNMARAVIAELSADDAPVQPPQTRDEAEK